MSTATCLAVTLDDADQALARRLAAARYACNRRSGTVNRRAGPQSDEATDLEGVAGEMAFCRAYGLALPNRLLADGPVRGADIILGRWRVDVKTTRYRAGRLLVTIGPGCAAPLDLYALMVGTFPRYECRGFVRADVARDPARIDRTLARPAYSVHQRELRADPVVAWSYAPAA